MGGFDVELTESPRGWELVDGAAIFAAVEDLTDAETYGTRFHGSIQFRWVNGALQWILDVHDDEQPKRPANAQPGDALLFAGNVLQKLDAERFAAVAKPTEAKQ